LNGQKSSNNCKIVDMCWKNYIVSLLPINC
jgi:hypothetical protein